MLYRFEERLGILAGRNEATKEQCRLARNEAMAWKKLMVPNGI